MNRPCCQLPAAADVLAALLESAAESNDAVVGAWLGKLAAGDVADSPPAAVPAASDVEAP